MTHQIPKYPQYHRPLSIPLRAVCAMLLLMAMHAQAHATKADKPNILFFIVDDMGMTDPGAYGGSTIATPNIDRLAAEGMRFLRAYSGCSVCAPARSTLMTGYHMGRGSVRGNSGGIPLRDSDVTIAEVLQSAGYVSGGFGKWGIGDLDTPGVPERQGFSQFFGYYHQVHAHYYFPEYLIDSGRKVPLPNTGFYQKHRSSGPIDTKTPQTQSDYAFAPYRIVEQMHAFIRNHKDQPFFCYVPMNIPHSRYEIPDTDPAWLAYKDKPWTTNEKVYAAFCSLADRQIGETLALLDELQLSENTLVVFCSDNGGAFPSKTFEPSISLRGHKGSLYEGGIRIPFIARWPNHISAGATCDRVVYFPDLMPTLAELTGTQTAVPADIDGVSFAPELLGKTVERTERYLYWEWNGQHFFDEYKPIRQAVRKGDWKLVRHELNGTWELFDLATDPKESKDLAGTHPKLVEELDQWVATHRIPHRPQQEPDRPDGQEWR
jgi:arylsulfatase A-like enzyme